MTTCAHSQYTPGCKPCATYSAADSRRYRRRVRLGLHQFPQSAAEVRAHLEALRSAGMGLHVVADQSGVSYSTIKKISAGYNQRVWGPNATAILAVTPKPAPSIATIPVTGSCRRARALYAIGWSFAEQARRIGVVPSAVSSIALLYQDGIRRDFAQRVAAVYDDLHAVDPPRDKARTVALYRAAERGWHGPEAWTDDTIDDPAAEPFSVEVFDEEKVRRAMNGHCPSGQLSLAERIEVYRRLAAMGASHGTIQNRMHMNGRVFRRLMDAVADCEQSAVAA